MRVFWLLQFRDLIVLFFKKLLPFQSSNKRMADLVQTYLTPGLVCFTYHHRFP